MGNLLAEQLKQAPHVLMAGYKSKTLARTLYLYCRTLILMSPVGHPNVPEVMIRIQTDGSMTPREALVRACKQLVAAYGQLGREFQKELALRQYADQGEQANNNNGNGPGHGGF